MTRSFDIVFSLFGLVVGFPLLVLLWVMALFDTGSPLFYQERVGLNQKPFILLKFRTMEKSTASVASHLASQSDITPYGRFLRSTKLDELPQLWNVLVGEMSLVGPRPCLFNQEELVAERARHGIFDARPGITGLAQVRGVDMSMPKKLVEIEKEMLSDLCLKSYLWVIILTVFGKGGGDRIGK